MGIDVNWQDENGKRIQGFSDKNDELSKLISNGKFTKKSFLNFIDPRGVTLFNQLQIPVLLGQLEALAKEKSNNEALREIIALIKTSKRTEHTYIQFIGDWWKQR